MPTFRRVAELGSVREAARELHVAPSAVSRTIKLLEESLGYTLFARRERKFVLEKEGQTLLESVRTAMRLVDDATTSAQSALEERILVATTFQVGELVLTDALRRVGNEHVSVGHRITAIAAEDIEFNLVHGRLDAVLHTRPVLSRGLETHSVGKIEAQVVADRRHPGFQGRKPTLRSLLRYPFVTSGGAGQWDPWPAELAMQPTLTTTSVHAALRLCADRKHIAIAPRGLLEAEIKALGLVGTRVSGLAAANMFLITRVRLSKHGLVASLVDELASTQKP